MTAEADVIVVAYCTPIKERIDRLIAELEKPIETPARDTRSSADTLKMNTGDTAQVPVVRRAASTVALVVCAAVLIVVFLAGGEMRGPPPLRVTTKTQRVNVSLDAKLAELRERPTLATVTYFRCRKPTPEIVAAMRVAAKCPNEDASIAAKSALLSWRID